MTLQILPLLWPLVRTPLGYSLWWFTVVLTVAISGLVVAAVKGDTWIF